MYYYFICPQKKPVKPDHKGIDRALIKGKKRLFFLVNTILWLLLSLISAFWRKPA